MKKNQDSTEIPPKPWKVLIHGGMVKIEDADGDAIMFSIIMNKATAEFIVDLVNSTVEAQ